MCDCIEILEEKLNKKCQEQSFKKPFKSVEIEQAFVMVGNTITTQTYSKAIVTLTGQKKKIEQDIMHSHCPFCGEKIVDPGAVEFCPECFDGMTCGNFCKECGRKLTKSTQ